MSTEEEQQLEANQANNQQPTKKMTPLPWDQLTPLLSVPLTEYINLDLILPFLYEMVDGFGIAKDPKDIAFYSSLLFVSFSLSQALTALHWGRLSDRIGRRPVLMAGLTGCLVSTLTLGIAPSFWVAICARSFNGFMAGNAVVVKSVISEISDNTNRSLMMSMLPLAWNIGTFLGFSIGGMLTNPAHQYPNLFGNVKLFIKFPYLLPCLVGSTFAVFGLFFSVTKFRETLSKKTTSSSVGSESDENRPLLREPSQQQKSMKELLTHTVAMVMVTNAITYISLTMYETTYTIFAATPAIDGGLGFSSRSIGISLAVGGIAAFYLQLAVYPKHERKYGPLACYQHGQKIIILYLLLTPFLSILASRAQSQHSPGNVEFYLLWLLLIILMLARITGQVLSLTSMNLLLANITPSRADFGTINGMQQLTFSSTRIVGPLISGTMWSWSIKHNFPYPFNYHLVWVSCAAVSSLSLYMTYHLPESVNTFAADQQQADQPTN